MTPEEKRRLKDAITVARISGGCRGLAQALAWKDCDRAGIIKGLNELADIAEELNKAMQDNK